MSVCVRWGAGGRAWVTSRQLGSGLSVADTDRLKRNMFVKWKHFG